MRVRFTQDTAAYLADQYRVESFKKGQEFDGPFAQSLLDTGCPVEVLDEDDPDGPGVDLDGDGVPEGSAPQVLDWVNAGGSEAAVKDRATLALTAEQAKEKPRSGLITSLTKLLG